MAKKVERKAEVRSMTFEHAKNGLVSRTHLRSKRSGQGGGPDYDYEEETNVHPTAEHAAAHLKKYMGGANDGDADDKE